MSLRSQYQSDEISRLHRKLLYTTIAIEYLHETVDDGRQKLRFVAAYKQYSRTPIEDSLEDVDDILQDLERRGLLGIGNYKILKDIVQFNVKIIEEIEKTEIAIRQIGGTVTPHTDNGCDIYLVAEVENSTTNEDEWKSASVAIKKIQIDLQSHHMKLTARNSHNFEWFSRNLETHLNLMKESNTILRLCEADEKDERIKNFVELAKASKEKLISNDDAFHEFSIRWRTLNKLMIENCKLIAFLQGKGAEFEGYIQSSLFVFLSFRSLEMLDSFWNNYKSGSLNREMRNAFFTDGGPENENQALRLNLSEENYHRYRRFLENQLRTGHDEAAGGDTQQEEPTSTTNEDIITVSTNTSSGEHKATTSHSNVSSARSPPAKRIRKAEGQISKHRYALRSRGPIPEIKAEPTRQPKPVQTSVTANETTFRKNVNKQAESKEEEIRIATLGKTGGGKSLTDVNKQAESKGEEIRIASLGKTGAGKSSTDVNKQAESTEEEIKIASLGKTGAGKSSTGPRQYKPMARKRKTSTSASEEATTPKTKRLRLGNTLYSPPDFIEELEKTNFCRVGMAIAESCTAMYRDVLHKEIKPADLLRIVSTTLIRGPLTKADLAKIENAEEDGYKAFDITLMYTLIRNFCTKLPFPTQGWGKIPHPNNTNVADDLERIRMIRNNFVHNATYGRMEEREYHKIWTGLKQVAKRMEELLLGKYLESLQELETYMYRMTHAKWKKCLATFEKWMAELGARGRDQNKNVNLRRSPRNYKSGSTPEKSNQSTQDSANDELPNWTYEEIRIVLLGKIGAGKSSTGNTLLMKKNEFKTAFSPKSCTKVCRRKEIFLKDKKLVIIDTPGFFDSDIDSEMKEEKLTQEMSRCVSMSTPGPHVFLYVQAPNKFSQEETNSVLKFFNRFGKTAEKFMIFILTRLDDLQRNNTTLKKYMSEVPDHWKEILRKCDNRLIGIDNTSDSTLVHAHLLKAIMDLIEKNGGEFYTNNMYIENMKRLRKLERQLSLKVDEKFQLFVGELEMKMKNTYKRELERLRSETDKELEKVRRESSEDLNALKMKEVKTKEEFSRKHSEVELRLRKEHEKELRKSLRDLQEKHEQEKEQLRRSFERRVDDRRKGWCAVM